MTFKDVGRNIFRGRGRQWKDQDREIAPISLPHFISGVLDGALGCIQGSPQGNAASKAPHKK